MSKIIKFPNKKVTARQRSTDITNKLIYGIVETLHEHNINTDGVLNELSSAIRLLEAIVDKQLGLNNTLLKGLEKLKSDIEFNKR
jgi:hypothetical protein